MEQTKALNALEPYLALTKSASSPLAAADLITRATSQISTFIFSELLLAPQIQCLSTSAQCLSTSAQSSHLNLLKIFSYGTFSDYNSTPDLPPLNEAQTLKLRQLSFLTLARDPTNLSYANLLKALNLETARELEDLVISAIYAGLLQATLDPYNQVVRVSSLAPLRDLAPNTIPSMLAILSDWSLRCTTTLTDLEKQIAGIKADAMKRHKEEQEWNAHLELLIDGKNGKKGQGQGQQLVKGGGDEEAALALAKKLGQGVAAKRASALMGLTDDNEDVDMDEEDEDGEEGRMTRSSKKRGMAGKMGFGK